MKRGAGEARDEVDHEAQGVVAAWLDLDPRRVRVSVNVRGPAHALEEWAAAEHAEEEAREAVRRAADRRRAVVRELRRERYSAPDIGRVLGISRQRVYQLERADTE